MTLPNIFTIDFLKAFTVRNYQQKAGTLVYKNVAVWYFSPFESAGLSCASYKTNNGFNSH